MRKEAIVLLTLIIVTLVNSQQWYSPDWAYRQQITINPSLTNSDLNNFPVLIAITTSLNPVFQNAQIDGDDILFTSDDGVTKLDHEIERYNAMVGSEKLYAWVKVPLVSSNFDTIIYMYYGNPNAGSQENPEAVWDSNYLMVHHFEETSGLCLDSTSYNNDGVPHNGVNQNANGVIDGAYSFDGQNDYVSIADNNSFDPIENNDRLTIESWVYIHGWYRGWFSILDKYEANGDFGWTFQINFARGISFHTGYSGDIYCNYVPALNRWYHLCMSYDRNIGHLKFYVNGQLQCDISLNSQIKQTNGEPCYLGYNPSGGDEYINGALDELRVSDIVRSADWIRASYNITSSPSDYLSFGSQEVFNPTPTPTVTPSPTITPTPTPAPLPSLNNSSLFIIIFIFSIYLFLVTNKY